MLPVWIYVIVCFSVSTALLAHRCGAGGTGQFVVIAITALAIPLQKFVHKGRLAELGYRRCSLGQAALGLLLPVSILGLIFLTDITLGFARMEPDGGASGAPLGRRILFLTLHMAVLSVLELIAEELMFRGYLLTKLRLRGETRALLITALVFSLWHLPVAIFQIGFAPLRTPLYLVNMFLLSVLFGLLFFETGSLIPVALFHGTWNTLEYCLSGFGEAEGLIVGPRRTVFDPEEGIVGTLCMALFVIILFSRSLLLRRGAARKPARTPKTAGM